MPNRESFAGCAVLQNEVALLGGGLHGRSMTLYNPTAQSWRTAEAPHTPHLHSAVASMQDSLFVLVSCSAVIVCFSVVCIEVTAEFPPSGALPAHIWTNLVSIVQLELVVNMNCSVHHRCYNLYSRTFVLEPSVQF